MTTNTMKTPQPKPDHIPSPPEGFEYFGKGPLPHESKFPTFEIFNYGEHIPNDEWTNDEWSGGFYGTSGGNHYAIRIGSELHRLNFGERKTTKAHPHVDLMRLYVEDAAETEKPWERWEYRYLKTWLPVAGSPLWDINAEYRRKTEPEGRVTDPQPNVLYWFVDAITDPEEPVRRCKFNPDNDQWYLDMGLFFHDEVSALERANRSIRFCKATATS